MKKLIPALCMLLIAATLMGTSTFAWFSMNNKVTVTGMEVRTKVSSNLFVAPTTIAETGHAADSAFAPAHDYYTGTATLLEPVSTVDGLNFFYTDKTNVGSIGNAKTAVYTALNTGKADPTTEQLTAFGTANGQSGSVGYKDFVFELKAVNANTSAKVLKLTKLDLVYTGATLETSTAFRAAVFMEKHNGTAYTMVSSATLPAASSIFTEASAVNFSTGKAVDSTTTLNTVTYNTAVSKDVAGGETEYYKVVVRIWLEGEDKTCNNTVFATLDANWVLDLAFEFDTETAATTVIGNTGVAATTAGVTLTGTDSNILSNGEKIATSNAFAWYNAATGAASGTSSTAPAAGSEDATYYCVVKTINGNTYVTNPITIAKS